MHMEGQTLISGLETWTVKTTQSRTIALCHVVIGMKLEHKQDKMCVRSCDNIVQLEGSLY